MFGIFKRKKREMPPFDDLNNSPLRGKYFIRLAPWDWLTQEMIHVFDLNSPRVITMDPWVQIIYLEADGQKTVHEVVHQMASSYSPNEAIPHELDKQIIHVIESLLKDKLIELLDGKKELPEHLKKPRSQVR